MSTRATSAEDERRCRTCWLQLERNDFSDEEWAKSGGRSRCGSCQNLLFYVEEWQKMDRGAERRRRNRSGPPSNVVTRSSKRRRAEKKSERIVVIRRGDCLNGCTLSVDLARDTVLDLKVKLFSAMRDPIPPDVMSLSKTRQSRWYFVESDGIMLKDTCTATDYGVEEGRLLDNSRTLREYGVISGESLRLDSKAETRATAIPYMVEGVFDSFSPLSESSSRNGLVRQYDILYISGYAGKAKHYRPLRALVGGNIAVEKSEVGDGLKGSIEFYHFNGVLPCCSNGMGEKIRIQFDQNGPVDSDLLDEDEAYNGDGVLCFRATLGMESILFTEDLRGACQLSVISKRTPFLRADVFQREQGSLTTLERAEALVGSYRSGLDPKSSFLHLHCHLPEDAVSIILEFLPRMEPPPALFAEEGDLFFWCSWLCSVWGHHKVQAVFIARPRARSSALQDPPHPSLESRWNTTSSS